AAFDILKEARIAAHAAHDEAGEEHLEEQSPAPSVPFFVVELSSFRGRSALQQPHHPFAIMHERQRAGTKQGKVALEFPGGADPTFDFAGSAVPKLLDGRAQTRPAALVEIDPPLARHRTDELQQFAMLQFAK